MEFKHQMRLTLLLGNYHHLDIGWKNKFLCRSYHTMMESNEMTYQTCGCTSNMFKLQLINIWNSIIKLN